MVDEGASSIGCLHISHKGLYETKYTKKSVNLFLLLAFPYVHLFLSFSLSLLHSNSYFLLLFLQRTLLDILCKYKLTTCTRMKSITHVVAEEESVSTMAVSTYLPFCVCGAIYNRYYFHRR